MPRGPQSWNARSTDPSKRRRGYGTPGSPEQRGRFFDDVHGEQLRIGVRFVLELAGDLVAAESAAVGDFSKQELTRQVPADLQVGDVEAVERQVRTVLTGGAPPAAGAGGATSGVRA